MRGIWPVATVILLSIALVLSIARRSFVDSAIVAVLIAVVALPYLVLAALWLADAAQRRRAGSS